MDDGVTDLPSPDMRTFLLWPGSRFFDVVQHGGREIQLRHLTGKSTVYVRMCEGNSRGCTKIKRHGC